jgi:hypothetical protein
MGTRHLVAVMHNKEYKIAQYGQWDGYPSGQGADVLSFLSDPSSIDRLKDALSRVRFLDLGGQDKAFMEEYNKNAPEWSNEPDNRTAEQKRWFEQYISRDIGSKILKRVAESSNKEKVVLKNNIGFAGDSLFCEYAYIVDLDKNTFEVFEGFNQDPVKEGRFVTGGKDLETNDNYEPVKILKTYQLDNLPTEETFLADLEAEEED